MIGEKTHDLIPAEKVKKNVMGNTIMEPNDATNAVAATRNGAVTFGVLGLCLGASLGIAGGLARRSSGGALAGGLLGAILGLASGAGVSWVLLPRFIAVRDEYFDYDLFISMGMHGLIWGLLGAAGGVAFAVGLGRYRLSAWLLFAGFIGAILGALGYDIIGAVYFTRANTDDPISGTWQTRLLASLLATLGPAVILALCLPDSRPVETVPGGQATAPAPGSG